MNTTIRGGALRQLYDSKTGNSPVPGFAGGGLIDKIKSVVGISTAPKPAPAPAPKPAPAPEPKNAPAPVLNIRKYAENNALDKRMNAAGLKDGGVIKGPGGALRKMAESNSQKSEHGGKLKGPGTATSDSIPATVVDTGEPIKVANGERIVSAKQDKALEREAKAQGHDSFDSKLEAMTGQKVGPTMQYGGAIRKMATGAGPEELRKRLLTQIPTGGTGDGPTAQPDPSQSASGSELGRNVTNTLSALPGAAPVAAGALRLAAAVPALNTAASGVASVAGRAATLAKPALPFAPPAALFAASGGQATEQAPAAIASTPAPVAAPAPAPERPANIAAAPTEASGALPKPANQVTRVGNSYSGGPGITGDISLVDGNGAPIRSGGAISPQNNQAADNLARRYGQTEGFGTATSGGGTVSTVPGMSQDKINATLTNPDGSTWSAQDNAIMQANIRDGVDPYSGTSRAKKQITMREHLAGLGEATARRGQDINAAAAGAVRKLAESKFNQESQLHNVDLQTKTNILNAQNAFIAAKTPEEKAAAEENFRALQGRYEKLAPELFDRIQTGVDPATGAPIYSVFNKRTGEVGPPATTKSAPYQDGATIKSKTDGRTYVVKNGVPVPI